MSDTNKGRCGTCHVETHWNKNMGNEVECSTEDCMGRVTPYGAKPPPIAQHPEGPETHAIQTVDIHIERVGDLMTASMQIEGFPEEAVKGFIAAVEGLVGPGNVDTDIHEPPCSHICHEDPSGWHECPECGADILEEFHQANV